MAKDLVEAMEFFKVDKISDDVYGIASNLALRFNVALSKISNGKRYHFHKEYEYPVNNLDGLNSLVTMRRSFDYYLSIENLQKDQNGNKIFIRIGPQEYILFKKALEEVITWFTDKKYEKLFVMDRGRLILTSPIPEYKIKNLPMQKYIEFSPTIIDRGISMADKEPGVRMTLGEPKIEVELNLDRLMGLYYTVSSLNMYQAALSIVNYLGRPEFDTNRYKIEQERTLTIRGEKKSVSGIEGRFVTPRNSDNEIDVLE